MDEVNEIVDGFGCDVFLVARISCGEGADVYVLLSACFLLFRRNKKTGTYETNQYTSLPQAYCTPEVRSNDKSAYVCTRCIRNERVATEAVRAACGEKRIQRKHQIMLINTYVKANI